MSCEGCAFLEGEGPHRQGDCWTLCCTDPDKPALGARRTVAVGWVGPPLPPQRPAWCRGKRKPPAGLVPRRTAKARR